MRDDKFWKEDKIYTCDNIVEFEGLDNEIYVGDKDKTMSKEMREQIDRVKNWKQFVNEDVNESEFGFGEFSKPKKEIYLQLMDRAIKDGLLSSIHYGDKRIINIAKEIATEFEKMEEWNRRLNIDLYLGYFYNRIPQKFWGEPTYTILMKYGLRKS